jgi:uncharacterized protein (DUF1501 family)
MMKNTELEMNINRRRLLKGFGVAASSGIALPLGLNFIAISSAAAQTTNDYRALVCVYLGGGNDHLNMVVPSDATSFNKYAQARGALTRTRSTLLSITPTTSQGGKEVGWHPSMPGLKSLFDSKQLAIVASTGPLIVPVTKSNYGSPTVPLPPQLGSHSDQGFFWMSSQGTGKQNGWCGRFGDALAARNSNPAFSTISVFGYTKILVGNSTSFYVASEYGAPDAYFDAGTPLDSALTRSSARKNLLEKAYAQVHENLRDNAAILSTAIAPESTFTAPPGGGRNMLAQQLLTVARIIAARNTIGAKRQIFYVQLGGFDTHSGQNTQHDALMTQLNDALVYFNTCMATLGTQNQATLFTFSEFGRTLTSNGDGTDHGWAGHQLVMGGAVNGGNIYGTLPIIDSNGPDFNADGVQIPTISVEQYGATLAKWIGVPDTPPGSASGIGEIFPNLGNFNQRDLGFLKT